MLVNERINQELEIAVSSVPSDKEKNNDADGNMFSGGEKL